ncbi:hypothetical protein PoB_005159100 [Plakobranchus ocellatus]|uniref:Peptidase S1 domain-containing protein n=1 Tax=Plakobranchus ocellatus TaxID=259542 RepID=A0AAV4BX41_9GAST|nr:hypothetical protein PoB_005159100 [Plakobranchus ocellatus]
MEPLDSVRKKIEVPGEHESQILEGFDEAAESLTSYQKCRKNRHHRTFIPITDFSMSHVPEEYRKEDILKSILNISARTVKVCVKYTSPERPNDYIFANCRGKTIPHTGSGFVVSVNKRRDPCPCCECRDSSSQYKDWFAITVVTARHVVYNSEEASFSQFDFFYDDKSQSQMKSLRAVQVEFENLFRESDVSLILCATHDCDLANTITGGIKDCCSFSKGRVCLGSDQESDKEGMLCIVVSHPHGQPKMVTVGRAIEWIQKDQCLLYSACYDTDTCPGSSGAPVILISSDSSKDIWALSHSSGGDFRGLNRSGGSYASGGVCSRGRRSSLPVLQNTMGLNITLYAWGFSALYSRHLIL